MFGSDTGLDPSLGHLPQPHVFQPHPIIRPELIDNNGTLRATDIRITWTGSDTFLPGVKIAGPDVTEQPTGPRPVRDYVGCDISTPRQPPTLAPCLEIPNTCTPLLRRPPQDNRYGYRPAEPIQRFNNKSLNWSSWFRHFRVVAHQRALQLFSYLDETAVNVEHELGDDLVSRPPGPDFMASCDVIMKTQIRLPTLSQTYVVSATRKAHQNFDRS